MAPSACAVICGNKLPPVLPPFIPSADAASRLTALLDSAMDAIVSIDEAGRIVMYNRAAEQTFGWSASEMLGQPLERLMPERFRAGHASHVRQFASTGVTARLKGSKGGGERLEEGESEEEWFDCVEEQS